MGWKGLRGWGLGREIAWVFLDFRAILGLLKVQCGLTAVKWRWRLGVFGSRLGAAPPGRVAACCYAHRATPLLSYLFSLNAQVKAVSTCLLKHSMNTTSPNYQNGLHYTWITVTQWLCSSSICTNMGNHHQVQSTFAVRYMGMHQVWIELTIAGTLQMSRIGMA